MEEPRRESAAAARRTLRASWDLASVRDCHGTMEERTRRERELRDYLIDRVLKEVPYTRLNGHPVDRLSNNANFAFQFIEGESLLIMLDMDGICGSSGSACTSDLLIRPMCC